MRKPVVGVSEQVRHKSDCIARGLRFRVKEVEGSYYLHVCSESTGADQLRSSFSHMQKAGFLMTRLK